MGGGAWPFLVGGVICQVNSGNERDHRCICTKGYAGLIRCNYWEAGGNNRSVMPLDVLGRTRATLTETARRGAPSGVPSR